VNACASRLRPLLNGNCPSRNLRKVSLGQCSYTAAGGTPDRGWTRRGACARVPNACRSRHAILDRAREEDRIVVSADSDFSAILASQEAARPSFILFRNTNWLVAEDYARALLPALPVLETELNMGCVVVFRSGRLRVRRLPFSDEG
jgi:predicted nuclease of predicted toxin-antitoxin system